ncbi:MAG: 3-oxoacyl-[acyl-carrier-protein] reductase [Armatimonadota bacterium]
MHDCLKDQVAIITGAGGGIGSAIAGALANAGADIVINDFGNEEGCAATAGAVEQIGRRPLVCQADVADMAAVEGMVRTVLDEFGRVDILVNNAGIARDALLVRMDEKQWDSVLGVHLRGSFCCTRAVARTMMKQRSGRIVFITSVVGLMGNVGQANYAAAKAGMIGLMKSAARELARRNVTANAIAPGFIETGLTDAIPDVEREQLIGRIPMQSLGQPEDVANAVLFLCSPAARYITGQVLNVDGGMVM